MSEETPTNRVDRSSFPLPALALFKVHNFRLWYLGQLISLTGTWMQTTAQGYYLYEQTHSQAYLGTLGFLSGAPHLIFMPWGGWLADRFPRKRILILTQIAMMALSLILTLLLFFQLLKPGYLLLGAFGLGIANALDVPARQAFLIEIIDRRYLTEAVALNSALFQGAMVLGPVLGGIVYYHYGPEWCFLLNTLSFLAILSALLAMDPSSSLPKDRSSTPFQGLKEAIRFVTKNPEVLRILLLVGSLSTLGVSFMSLLPAWAKEILHGDARTLGYLHTSRALGALGGVLFIATTVAHFTRERIMRISLFLFPLGLWLFGLSQIPLLSYLYLLGAGTFLISLINLSNSFVQIRVSDRLRGRVMSLFSLTFFGGIPLGSLIIGGISELVGLRGGLIICASSATLIAFIFAPYFKNREGQGKAPISTPQVDTLP